METGYQMPQTMESTLCELSIVMNQQGRISGKIFSGILLFNNSETKRKRFANIAALFLHHRKENSQKIRRMKNGRNQNW